jgi:hypothetical protein
MGRYFEVIRRLLSARERADYSQNASADSSQDQGRVSRTSMLVYPGPARAARAARAQTPDGIPSPPSSIRANTCQSIRMFLNGSR